MDEAPDDDATRQSYNVAPGYYELVYRADVPDSGAGGRTHDQKEAHHDEAAAEDEQGQERGDSDDVKYKLQAMKWGACCTIWQMGARRRWQLTPAARPYPFLDEA